MKIAREGLPFVGLAVVFLVVLALAAWRFGEAWWIAPLVWAPIALWVPWFFRDPLRPGPRGTELVIAPADGRIIEIDEFDEPDFLQSAARRVSIFMNVFDVHVNRYPVSGSLAYRHYEPGRFFNASLDKASQFNERMSVGIRGPRGSVLVRQIAGLIARRIVADHEVGHTANQGGRLGIIRFGSRVDTFVAMDATIRVKIGDRVHAGQTVIAQWDA